jgi:Starch-binding associating with outer membrane
MKKYLFIFLAGSGVVISGCKKNFLDLNSNPNFPSSVPAASLIAAAEVKTANLMVDPSFAQPMAWMQLWSYSPNFAVNQDTRDYKFNTNFGQPIWTNHYNNAFDYQKIIDFAIQQNNPAQEAIGRTMKSLVMQNLVDVYNNVPYTDAFKGALNPTPAYESGQAVYEKIYDDLTLAITKFNAALATDFPTSTQDILFSGNKARWIKFANTLKLKLLIRQAGRADRASYITGKIASDFPGGLASFLQADELATVNPGFTNSSNQQTPFWANFGYTVSGTKTGNNDFFRVSAYAVNFYTTQTDIRGFYTMKPVGAGSGPGSMFGSLFRGNELGQQGIGSVAYSDVMDNADNGGSVYRSPSQDQPILTDFESLFLQAEAVQRGWFPGSAQTIFNKAMLQSFKYMFDAVDGAGSGASYLGALTPTANNTWALATNKIQLIITQKWASLNTINMLEPWTEYRRTGFPNVPLSSSASRGPNIPYRYKYPQTEYDLNGGNAGAQGTIDQFTSKIWWMP